MHVRIHHATRYSFSRPTVLGPHTIRLRPTRHSRVPLYRYDLECDEECDIFWYDDPWNNPVARACFNPKKEVEKLGVVVDATFDLRAINPFDFLIDSRFETVPMVYPDGYE